MKYLHIPSMVYLSTFTINICQIVGKYTIHGLVWAVSVNSNIFHHITYFENVLYIYNIKGILAAPPKATPPRNKALLRVY